MKILPFFAVLIAIDLLLNFSRDVLFEGLTEITLLHGFIPQSLSVIGVGWYLGTVFVFYLIFPFFCMLIENKRRAWAAFAASIGLHSICRYCFMLDRHNIVFSLCYFLAGGLVYLYRKELTRVNRLIYLLLLCAALGVYYIVGSMAITVLLVVSLFLILGISIGGGRSRIVAFISGISMEIYLSHMVIFRAVERLGLNRMLGNGWVQYTVTSLLVLVGTVVFSCALQRMINLAEGIIGSRK